VRNQLIVRFEANENDCRSDVATEVPGLAGEEVLAGAHRGCTSDIYVATMNAAFSFVGAVLIAGPRSQRGARALWRDNDVGGNSFASATGGVAEFSGTKRRIRAQRDDKRCPVARPSNQSDINVGIRLRSSICVSPVSGARLISGWHHGL
jgi:hypothetical protein